MRPHDAQRFEGTQQYLVRDFAANEAEARTIAEVMTCCETVVDVLSILGEPESETKLPEEVWDEDGYNEVPVAYRWQRSLSWWTRWPHVSFTVQVRYDGELMYVLARGTVWRRAER